VAKFNIFRVFYGCSFAAAKDGGGFSVMKQRCALAHGKVTIGIFPVYHAFPEFPGLAGIPDGVKTAFKNISKIVVVYPAWAAGIYFSIVVYFHGTKRLAAGKLFIVHTIIPH
jgi:hypothetical protein